MQTRERELVPVRVIRKAATQEAWNPTGPVTEPVRQSVSTPNRWKA